MIENVRTHFSVRTGALEADQQTDAHGKRNLYRNLEWRKDYRQMINRFAFKPIRIVPRSNRSRYETRIIVVNSVYSDGLTWIISQLKS